jgi:hypothetical protein
MSANFTVPTKDCDDTLDMYILDLLHIGCMSTVQCELLGCINIDDKPAPILMK